LDSTVQNRLQAAEEKLKERRKVANEAYNAQRADDMERIVEAIDAAGVSIHKRVRMPFLVDGLPVTVAVKQAGTLEMRRYKDRTKNFRRNKDNSVDLSVYTKAYEELASSSVIWPDQETFAKMCAEFPTLKSDVGAIAVKLREADEEDEGND